jgi:hypothetical protein
VITIIAMFVSRIEHEKEKGQGNSCPDVTFSAGIWDVAICPSGVSLPID